MNNFTTDIDNCIAVLQNGGNILYPTDTIWGIGCDATNYNAVNKIITLKQRQANKSFVVLVSSLEELQQYITNFDEKIIDYLQQQTKPTTVIYSNAINLAKNVLAQNGSVAIRICKDDFCKTLIQQLKKPIVSTSANISNEPSPDNFLSISKEVINKVDYVVKHRQNETTIATPSTIIQWIKGNVVILR